jgi:hypothetical protein
MSGPRPLSTLPLPPAQYDARYMAMLVDSMEQFMRQSRNPGPGRFTNITLTALPTSATGLASGTLWNDTGTLKVAP